MPDSAKVLVQKLHKDAVIPEYQTEGAAGADLHACLDAPVRLAPGERAAVSTGLALAIPEGFEAQVRPRSGLALKHGVTLPNAPGTIDSDYRGELKVIVLNAGNDPFEISHGDRIAQIVIAPVTRGLFAEASELPATVRGDGGFGSTGVGVSPRASGHASGE